ncbi:unnamed protein product [Ambrosiozyma monospora]|uniref:Unnamed protein product n=1 Tax=Ambrosiozyma monospora TaxID=43982 RepID=A0ACB5TAW2_AMBMO|nr:unnamed protein product [Ambrosiozyma monospora]
MAPNRVSPITFISISIVLQTIVFAFLFPTTFRVVLHYYVDWFSQTFFMGCFACGLTVISMFLNVLTLRFKDITFHAYTVCFTFISLVLTIVFTAESIVHRNDDWSKYISDGPSNAEYHYEITHVSIPSNLIWLIWFTIPLTFFMAIANYCTYRATPRDDIKLEIPKVKASVRVLLLSNLLISVIIFSLPIVVIAASEENWQPNNGFLGAAIGLSTVNMIMCMFGYGVKVLVFHIPVSLLLLPLFGISVFEIKTLHHTPWTSKLFIVISVLVGVAEVLQVTLIALSVKDSRFQSCTPAKY